MLCPNPLVIVLEYFSRLRKFWFQNSAALVWLLLSIPVMISFHSIVHEGTHSLMAFFSEGEFAKIEPFLMNYDGKFQNGMTVGVYVKVKERNECVRKPPVQVSRLAGWAGWPQIVALLITIGLAAIFIFIRISNPIVGFLARFWFLAAAGDFIFNTAYILFGHCKASQDWAKVMYRGDHGFAAFRWFTLLLWLILLSHFAWLCWSKWWTEPLPDRPFWGYRWAAFTLGILASISLLFYSFVRDPDIGYTSAPYLLGLFLQIAAWGFYWVYFTLTFIWDKPQENSPAV